MAIKEKVIEIFKRFNELDSQRRWVADEHLDRWGRLYDAIRQACEEVGAHDLKLTPMHASLPPIAPRLPVTNKPILDGCDEVAPKNPVPQFFRTVEMMDECGQITSMVFFEDLRPGDIFRLREPDGSIVGRGWYVCTKEPEPAIRKGNYQVNVEPFMVF